jgi:hypothetical protein
MEMWKAKNASHISTAPTTTATGYTHLQTKTGNSSYRWMRKTGQVNHTRRLHAGGELDEASGAEQGYQDDDFKSG